MSNFNPSNIKITIGEIEMTPIKESQTGNLEEYILFESGTNKEIMRSFSLQEIAFEMHKLKRLYGTETHAINQKTNEIITLCCHGEKSPPGRLEATSRNSDYGKGIGGLIEHLPTLQKTTH